MIGLNNTGVGMAQNDAYALLATSPRLTVGGRGEQSPTPDIRAVGINTFPVAATTCSAVVHLGLCRQHLGASATLGTGQPPDLPRYEPGRHR